MFRLVIRKVEKSKEMTRIGVFTTFALILICMLSVLLSIRGKSLCSYYAVVSNYQFANETSLTASSTEMKIKDVIPETIMENFLKMTLPPDESASDSTQEKSNSNSFSEEFTQ